MPRKKQPKLAVFWGDTRELLSKRERDALLSVAILESITPNEVLLRDRESQRLIVVTSVEEGRLFCTLCKTDAVRERYGRTCPQFAKCLLNGEHQEDSADPHAVKKEG